MTRRATEHVGVTVWDDMVVNVSLAKPLSAMDLLQDAGLVNYFGALQEVENAVVSPVLIGKGTARLALYGLGRMNL